jgi:hypothetical protein
MQLAGPHVTQYQQTAAGIDASACLEDTLR